MQIETPVADASTLEPVVARTTISASSMGRRAACPGSAEAESGLADTPSPYAEEGTLLHYLDSQPSASRDDLTDSQLFTLDKNSRLREKALAAFFIETGIPTDARRREFVEREFWLCDENGIPVQPGVTGHPDRVLYFPDYHAAVVFDSKFGRLPVSKADINLQLRSYLVMFSEHFELNLAWVVITQPWMAAPDDFHCGTYDATAIPAAKTELLAIIKATQQPDAKRNPSREACLYCRAKGVCKEALTIAADLAILKIKDMPIPELEAMGDTMALAGAVIEAWGKRMKELAGQGLLKFYELGTPAKIRSFNSPKKVFDVLRAEGLLTGTKEEAFEQFLTVAEPSVAKTQKFCHVVWKKADKKTSEVKSKERMELMLSGLIETKEKSPSLKRKNDTAPQLEE
jgi:Protein of unknown function (DUF2800)